MIGELVGMDKIYDDDDDDEDDEDLLILLLIIPIIFNCKKM